MSGGLTVRALRPADASAAGAVVERTFQSTPYLARSRELLHDALAMVPHEHLGLVAVTNDAAAGVAGLLVQGEIGGAPGAWRISLLAPLNRATVLTALISVAMGAVESAGARLVVAELADDPLVLHAIDALLRAGFVAEGLIPDLYRDGTGQRLFIHRFAR
ncbi:MAG: hypothetical protein H0W68_09265 [Gemmatimonadaceae bacterium]|nr:hypothetical protein [Gemmatimonadaceae bacterium]